MTFQLQTDRKPFQFHLIHIGMNPLTGDASTRSKEDLASIRHVYLEPRRLGRTHARSSST
jgi:hypothetical protein